MADATIEVPEEGSVVLDVSDNPALAEATPDDLVNEPIVELSPEAQPEPKVKINAKEREAKEALTQAVKTAEDARRAAEATALAERRKADEATRLAQQRTQEALAFRDQVEDRELTIITSGIENAKRELDTAQADMERALEAGEFSKASASQVRLSKAASALDRLEDAKFNYEASVRNRVTEGAVNAPVISQTTPFEQYVSSFAPRAQAWLRAHPECAPTSVGGDGIKNAAMMEGHHAALRQSIPEGSDEYFRVLDERAGYRAPAAEADYTAPRTAKPRVQPSAPVSREPPAANGTAPRTTRSVRLSPEQQDMAKISFPHLTDQQAFAQYARNLIELEAEKMMGRTSH